MAQIVGQLQAADRDSQSNRLGKPRGSGQPCANHPRSRSMSSRPRSRALYRVGPSRVTWPGVLTGSPYQWPGRGRALGHPHCTFCSRSFRCDSGDNIHAGWDSVAAGAAGSDGRDGGTERLCLCLSVSLSLSITLGRAAPFRLASPARFPLVCAQSAVSRLRVRLEITAAFLQARLETPMFSGRMLAAETAKRII
jgi:hypothetical protein